MVSAWPTTMLTPCQCSQRLRRHGVSKATTTRTSCHTGSYVTLEKSKKKLTKNVSKNLIWNAIRQTKYNNWLMNIKLTCKTINVI